MDRSLKVALVTGGAHGIGAAIASRLASESWRVVVADIDARGGVSSGGRFTACDVSDESAVKALITGIAAQEGRLDALVCNAGVNVRKPISELSLAEWLRVIGTNLTSTFLLVRASEHLLRAG